MEKRISKRKICGVWRSCCPCQLDRDRRVTPKQSWQQISARTLVLYLEIGCCRWKKGSQKENLWVWRSYTHKKWLKSLSRSTTPGPYLLPLPTWLKLVGKGTAAVVRFSWLFWIGEVIFTWACQLWYSADRHSHQESEVSRASIPPIALSKDAGTPQVSLLLVITLA